MTPPNNTVAGLAEKWRADADFYRRAGEGDKAVAYDRCADELEAALASPAPSAGVEDDAFADLRRFYGVETDAELIRAQAQHIERLQEKLPRNDQPAFIKPRFA